MVDEVFTEDLVWHGAPPEMPSGKDDAKHLFEMWLEAFPDVHLTVEDLISEGDKVVGRWVSEMERRWRATIVARDATVLGEEVDRARMAGL